MAQARPHFERHAREAIRTRRRFGIWTAGMIVLLAVAVGVQRHESMAAVPVTVSGRVVNASTGAGLPNVRVQICGAGIAYSSSAGYWSYAGLLSGQSYCVKYAGGAPSTVTGPYAVANNVAIGNKQPSYLNQVAGEYCIKNNNCTVSEKTWDRSSDSGFDLVFTNKAGVALDGTGDQVGVGALVLGAHTESDVAQAASVPSAPANFQATVGSDNAVVTLTWMASTSSVGIKDYVLQRSLDDATWSTVASNITRTEYTDKTADFGVHYYYQLEAVDLDGDQSTWASTDAITPGFVSNDSASSGGSTNTSYTSDDGLVSVQVPADAFSGNQADCSVTNETITKEDSQPGSGGQTLVMGPYELVCKGSTGQPIPPLTQNATWVFSLKGKLGNLNTPFAYSYSSGDGSTQLIPGGTYSAGTGNFTVSTTITGEDIIIMASKPGGIPVNLILAIICIILIIIGISFLILRQQQKASYENYLRKKYYNV